MLPEVAKLLSLDVFCDGGSLCASFFDDAGTQHELVFLIKQTNNRNEPVKQYRSVKIESFIKSKHVSPITGVIIEKTDKIEEKIAWHEAVDLLKKIEPYTYTSEYFWVFNSMLTIASSDNHTIKYF